MSLALYNKKRSFKDTPEPSGKKAAVDTALRFVIQKHDASRLHYDFRLEMEGVLKSWAVPKGPSLDPKVKRLAMMVEDHPYDYRTFEGIIPKGNYGAGTVIVWDEGTYEPLENTATNKKDHEKNLLSQLYKGSLKFVMNGKKLKGEFALVKLKNSEDNSWLLIKHNDKFATEEDITKKDKSVQSNKTLEQVEKTSDKIWKSNRESSSDKKPEKKISGEKKNEQTEVTKEDTSLNIPQETNSLLRKGTKAAFPVSLKPMLATLTDKPFDSADWIYEIKWDGYRAVAFIKNEEVDIFSRNNISFNDKFKPVVEALKQLKINAVIDGEIIALNEKGQADFQQLQNYQKTGKTATLVYYVFDLIWYEGKDYMQLPLIERKELLKNVLPANSDIIKFSDHVHEQGKTFFELAINQGLEGIMAKKTDSEYLPDVRTKSWLKIKNNKQLEAIICGYTKPRNSRKNFGALILGMYEGTELFYIGHTGSGFNETTLKDVYQLLQPLVIEESPFKKKPKTNMPVTWIKPQLVCEIKFTEWTDEKILRHPIFLGLREDKSAANEKNVKVVHPPDKKVEDKNKKPAPKTKTAIIKKVIENIKNNTEDQSEKTSLKKEEKISKQKNLLLPDKNLKEQIVTINQHQLKLTNLDKFYWPEEKITKRDMLNYYDAVTPFMLPYMKDRPQSLNRHPNGINGPSFYQKDVKGKVADWLKTYRYKSESSGDKDFLVCTDEASLLYIATLGCIEMNPWHSRIQSPDNPDWCVIDLDPDDNAFEQVIEAAQIVKQVLESVDVSSSLCKTSGSTGIHIYIPLGAKYNYDQSRMLAELIVTLVHHEIPNYTSLERNLSKRKGKIYLDFLQNRQIQTIAAPYSLRPKPGATVSTPLHWEEVEPGLSIQQFTIFNILDRLKNEGDIFKGVLDKGIDLEKTLNKINELLNK